MTRLGCVLVLVVVAAAYLPHLVYGSFVYEDVAHLQAVTGGPAPDVLAPRGLFRSLWWLQGQTPQVFHAVSLGLHAVGIALSAGLYHRLGLSASAVSLAVVAMVIPAVSVESVAYAAQQGELLAAIGVMGACLLAAGRWWHPWTAAGIAAFLVFGMLGKESAVVGLLLVPLIIAYRSDRWRQERPIWAPAWLPGMLAGSLLIAGTASYGGVSALASVGEAAYVTVDAVTWVTLQSTAAMRTLGLLVLPIGPFTVDYDYDAVSQGVRWACAVGLAGLPALAFWLRKRVPLAAVGLVAILVVLLPRLVVQSPRSYFNDHQAYLFLPWWGLIVGGMYDQRKPTCS